MKALTSKSRTAILIFLSVIALTIVARSAILNEQANRESAYNKEQYLVINSYKNLRQKDVISKFPVLSKKFIQYQTHITFQPWTAAASPRGPPAV